MMKVGFDAKRLFNNKTGLGNYSRTLVSNLYRYFPSNEYYLYSPKIIRNNDTEKFLRDPFNVRISSIPSTFYRTFAIIRDLKADNLDVYHGLSHELPYRINKLKLKSVVTVHDVIHRIYPQQYNRIDRKIYETKLKYALEKADKVFSISLSTTEDIIKHYGIPEKKIITTGQSIDEIFFKEIKASEKKAIVEYYNLPKSFLLYVGSIVERKHLFELVRAYEILQNDIEIPLVVVGSGGEYYKKIMGYIEGKELKRNIIFLDNSVSFKHLPSLYSLADLFIYPSEYEGFGLPVAEAMSQNCPVITGNSSSLPEVGGDACLYCNPFDINDIADKISGILNNIELKNRLTTEGLKKVVEFKSEVITDRIHSAYLRF